MRTIVAFCLCLYSLCATAQKHDYVWLSGYDSHVGYNPQDQWHTGTTVLDFNVQPVAVGYDSIYMNFDFTNVSFCDSSGNLLFYSNGMYIANSLGDTIENGNNINAGVFHDLWESEETGYRAIQGILALPVGGLRDKYTLLHTFYENSQNVYAFVKSILMSQVDMAANMGFGKIDFTNQALMADVLGQSISATKHGNGADWWVIAQKRNTNCFYKIKVDRFGVAVSDTQCLGAIFEFGSLSTSCFSSDGSKYIHLNTREGLNIYDFDRCSGLLSMHLKIEIPIYMDSSWIGMGVSVSPNNRFLYVSATKHLYQYDLLSNDIQASKLLIAEYDGYQSPFGSYFNVSQLAPDGRIYISCGNTEDVYHVIYFPDEKGVACNIQQHDLHLPSVSKSVPNFPNYRLGALPGSACDTLTDIKYITEKEKILKVFPNPAIDVVTIDYGYTDWSKGEATMEISNNLGQVVHSKSLPMYSGFQKLQVGNYPSGSYTVYIKRKGNIVATGRLVKE